MLIPVEMFFLGSALTGTRQQRIRQTVTDGILAGRYRAGDKLPSSRALAAHLGLARITVTLAYAELVAADYLVARGRSGYFVSDTAPRQQEFTKKQGLVRDAVDYAALTGRRFSSQPGVRKPADWREYPYPFIYGQADAALFDHQNWRLCALQALGRRDFAAMTTDYHETDDPMLIDAIIRLLLPRRGITASPDQVLLTLGAQNALWLASQVLLGPGRRAAIENPCYPGLRQVLSLSEAQVFSVDVDAHGLPPDRLPGRVDVVFTTASHHSPTNATMPMDRRMALLQAASARDFVIVEDDYEFEMSFLKSVSPSLKSLDTEGRVIHAGSFSKSLFPGLRLGYLVGPAAFIHEARALRSAVLRHPPGHIQRTVAYFLGLGHYDALVNRMKQAFKRRRQVMDEAIAEAGMLVAGRGAFGGSSFWMEAPGVDTLVLAARLRADGVLIEPGRGFYGDTGPSHFYRLAYSSIAPARIPEGIARIGRALALTA